MNNIELKEFWEKVKEGFLSDLPENVHPWISPLEISGYDNGTLTLVTGQIMGRDILRKNYYDEMVSILKTVSGTEEAQIVIIYDENAAKKLKKESDKINRIITENSLKEQALDNLANMQSAANLNLKYKFENFVVGPNNKFAHAAALSVAQHPAGKYNPLFIYGSAGLGKTHLMQAIGHYTLFNNPKLKVKYTTTEDYINDFISNSRKTKDTVENMSKFNRKYTNVDIILIDDIQYIESKSKTMEQILHTFNTLHNKGKQIVITSDRLPKDIPTLSKALCSRFEMGLMVEIIPPDENTRYEIVKKLAGDSGVEFENEALRYIARNFKNNVRELEGAFIKVCAYSEVMNQDITLELAKEVLKCDENENSIDCERIIEVTADYCETSKEDILGKARNQKVAFARHLAIYLSREITGESYVDISKFFNQRHPTVMYAYENIKKQISTNKQISSAVREIKQALKLI